MFQSPQKPKGDCDCFNFPKAPNLGNNVPITPKAERRLWQYLLFHFSVTWFRVPITPKAERRLWRLCSVLRPIQFSKNVPITPKAERRLWHWKRPPAACDSNRFQSPQKPKGDCDLPHFVKILIHSGSSSNHPKSRKAIVTSQEWQRASWDMKFQSPQKPKGDCDFQLRFGNFKRALRWF